MEYLKGEDYTPAYKGFEISKDVKTTAISLMEIQDIIKSASTSQIMLHNFNNSSHTYVPEFIQPLLYPHSQYDYQYRINDIMFAPIYARKRTEVDTLGVDGIVLGISGDTNTQVIAKVISPEYLL
jgi:hypothetical protein